MTPLAPYTITQSLSHGSRSTLYRAIRNADGRPVVLKVLDPQCSRPKDLEQLKNEFEIGRVLDSAGVAKPLAIDTYQGMPALVLEDFGGGSLGDVLGAPMPVERFLPLALRISRQGMRMTKLVNDLLDSSRIEAGPLPLELTSVDLGALVREVVARFEADLAQSRCSVSIHVVAPVVGKWDRSRIDQVVTNLLSNAIKFGPGEPIEIFLGAVGGVARLAVRDHGIGISPDQRDRIFGRFERAVSERHYGGLGLGFYISREIVEEHGGSIRCDSRPDAGSTFTVELPCMGPP